MKKKTKKAKAVKALEQKLEPLRLRPAKKKDCPAVEMAKRILKNAKWVNINLGIELIPMSMYLEVLSNIIKAK